MLADTILYYSTTDSMLLVLYDEVTSYISMIEEHWENKTKPPWYACRMEEAKKVQEYLEGKIEK